jgi:hypothetical protein
MSLIAAILLGCATNYIVTPGGKRLPSLTNVAAFAPENQKALPVISEYLSGNGEQPDEFYVEVGYTLPKSGLVGYHLWHISAFSKKYKNVMGNPGGKCRDVYLDPAQTKVVSISWWQ